MKLQHLIFAVAMTTASTQGSADVLANVGPTDSVTGFPAYYQDFGDLNATTPEPLALDLCLPNKIPSDMSELADGSCLLLPGDIPDETQQISFPDNFPEEAFYYASEASMPLAGGGDALLVMAVEAAFANAVQAGDQIVFARLRYRFRAPSAGYYTIETPYKTDGPILLSSGELAFNTEDIGVNCAQGDFSCALAGSIAPFLRASDSEGGAAKPLYEAHGNKYLAAPGINTFVTGSPLNHNYFRILFQPDLLSAPTIIGATNQFQLMGRLFDGSVPKPIAPSKPKPPVGNPPVASTPVSAPVSPLPTVDKPKVTITAVDSLASEASGDAGRFMINLNAPSAKAIKVKFKVEGSAKKGKDYVNFGASLDIPAGSVFGVIDVVPVDDKKQEKVEKVIVKLANKGTKNYIVKGGSAASVKIFDND